MGITRDMARNLKAILCALALAVLALATPSAASGDECTAAQLAEIPTCQGKLTAPTWTDKAVYCTYMQAYIDCIAHENAECCEVASIDTALDALKAANSANLAANCEMKCGSHDGHDHGSAATGVRASGFAALAVAVVAIAAAAH